MPSAAYRQDSRARGDYAARHTRISAQPRFERALIVQSRLRWIINTAPMRNLAPLRTRGHGAQVLAAEYIYIRTHTSLVRDKHRDRPEPRREGAHGAALINYNAFLYYIVYRLWCRRSRWAKNTRAPPHSHQSDRITAKSAMDEVRCARAVSVCSPIRV